MFFARSSAYFAVPFFRQRQQGRFTLLPSATTGLRARLAWTRLLCSSSGGGGGDDSGHQYNRKSTTAATSTLPYRQYGYRATPFSWDELVEIINGSDVEPEPNLAKLSRSVEQERSYGIAKEKVLLQYETLHERILHSVFGLKREFNEETQKWRVPLPPPPSHINDTEEPPAAVVVVPNEFPYFLEPGVEHWVLWKLYEDITELDVERAMNDLKLKLKDVVDTLWWENPPHLKSLPQINHVHILVRRKTIEHDDLVEMSNAH